MNDTHKAYLGIDFGLSRVGFAIARGGIAGPLDSCATKMAIEHVQEIISKEQPSMIVIGKPTGSLKNNVKAFGEELNKITSLPLTYTDETDTTQLATNTVREHTFPGADDHAVAAKFILENFLETHQ